MFADDASDILFMCGVLSTVLVFDWFPISMYLWNKYLLALVPVGFWCGGSGVMFGVAPGGVASVW